MSQPMPTCPNRPSRRSPRHSLRHHLRRGQRLSRPSRRADHLDVDSHRGDDRRRIQRAPADERRGNILEANMSQTIGSASSSVASGVSSRFLHCSCGASSRRTADDAARARRRRAGDAVMIPLRRLLIEREHGDAALSRRHRLRRSADRERRGGADAGVFAGSPSARSSRPSPAGCRSSPTASRTCRCCPRADRHRDFPGAVRRRLHPRPARRHGHGRRRTAVVAGDHPAHRVWGRAQTTPFFPEPTLTIAQMNAGPDLVALRPLHRRRARRDRRHHHAHPQLPDDGQSFRVGTAQMREKPGQVPPE